RGGGRADLKNGVQQANIPYCAPMQLFHGVAARMLDDAADWLFAPMILELPRTGDETHSSTCPIVQASPGVIRQALMRDGTRTQLIDDTISMCGDNFDSAAFRKSCRDIAVRLGAGQRFKTAFRRAARRQQQFMVACREIGGRAVDFAREHDVPAVVVLGRGYTIYNDVLNSNVPHLLRELGAMAVPVDCYPLAED
ncbi:MAG: CoA activase, partial [Phycisphaeraceae bacterium]|nr:CoA activase [Phycisphaeraceae bacterium]